MISRKIDSPPRRCGVAVKYFLPIALACYVALWIALAIRPLDRGDWLLENLLIFATAAVLIPAYWRFRFSNVSYALILIFLVFHTIGAHYTYSKVPIGFWVKDWLHLERNHYDRAIHFSFGFLLLYPMRELLIRCAHAYRYWATWLAVAALCALSSFFEIIEAVVAQIVAPDLGITYLGTQGDIWDAQKDMSAAFVGAIIVATCLNLYPHLGRRKLSCGESETTQGPSVSRGVSVRAARPMVGIVTDGALMARRMVRGVTRCSVVMTQRSVYNAAACDHFILAISCANVGELTRARCPSRS